MNLHARAAAIQLVAAALGDDGLAWIEVMPVIEKARNGPWFFTVTRDDLETYAASIRASAGRALITRDHRGDTANPDLRDTRAAGWFTGQAEVRGDTLWAEVEWTPAAAQEIRDGEFRFISPEFTFAAKDPKTGLMTKAKDLLAATLTNRPFFKELAPVTAAVVWDAQEGYQSLSDRVFQVLNPGGYDNAAFYVMDVAPGKALVREYEDDRTWVVEFTVADSGEVDLASRSDWTPAEQEWVDVASAALAANRAMRPFTEGAPMHESLKAIAAELGLADDADDAAVLAAVKTAKETAENAPTTVEGTVVLTSEQVAELQTNAAAGLKASEQLKALRIDSLLADAVRAGRIVPAQKDSLRAWGLQDEDALKTHIDATPEHTFATRARGSDTGAGDSGGPDLEQVAEAFAHEDYGIDEEQAALHVKATELLATAGKQTYTADEYLAAMAAAQRELGTTYRERPKATRGEH